MTIDIDRNLVTINGDFVPLTQKEYQIVHLLGMRKRAVLSKDAFISHIYRGIDEPETKIIDVFICKLRKKLSLACMGENYIETVWGRGYVLRDPEEQAQAA